ncbi:MAG: hypothetical protein EA401_06995 [Planctomycetota bacterium]|nr:MAG: hypothetical protein EA401_06995 [Planctomycetota bacterium]
MPQHHLQPPLPNPMHEHDSPLRCESILTMAANEQRILWIGNSLTFEHRLPRLVQQLAAAIPGTPSMGSYMITRGGADLGWHRQQGIAQTAIACGVWHYVVIQDQSTRPAYDPQQSATDAAYFAQLAHSYGACPLLYCTWATRDNPALLDRLEATYAQAASQADCGYAPVGRAFALSLQRRPTLALHREDHLHPTMAGSYLAACVWLGMLHSLPRQLPCQIRDIECMLADLRQDDADHLLECARSVLQHGASTQGDCTSTL